MAPFIARAFFLAVASEDSVLILDLRSGVAKNASIPQPQVQPQVKQADETEKKADNPAQKPNSEDYSHLNVGTCLAFSPCCKYLALCTPDKVLVVWESESLTIVKQWKAARKVSALTFNSDSTQLFVADKAGDCYAYSLKEANSEKDCTLLLGHLSMLLDVVVSHDDKFIITAERDEKIRISCLPNAYNIHSYCLGHTEFVTSLVFIHKNMLLSGSGDGTLRVWDYSTGSMLHMENLRESSDKEMEKAVRTVAVFHADPTVSIVAVLLDRVRTVYIFKVSDEPVTFQRQVLEFSSQPLEATFAEDGLLYVLTDNSEDQIEVFSRDEAFQYTSHKSSSVSSLLAGPDHLKIIQDCVYSCNGDLKPLFKRWFDNVQAYRERKNEQKLKDRKPVDSNENGDSKRLRVE